MYGLCVQMPVEFELSSKMTKRCVENETQVAAFSIYPLLNFINELYEVREGMGMNGQREL